MNRKQPLKQAIMAFLLVLGMYLLGEEIKTALGLPMAIASAVAIMVFTMYDKKGQ